MATQETIKQKTLHINIAGVVPTMMSNGQTADPLNKYTKMMKPLASKRKKSDEEYGELSLMEWESRLYINDDGLIIWPGMNIEVMIRDAAKKSREGKKAQAGLFADDFIICNSEFPKGIHWEDVRGDERYVSRMSVRVSTSRVMRTRPIIHNWFGTIRLQYDDEMHNERDIISWVETAGSVIGLSEFRPRYGRFEVVK